MPEQKKKPDHITQEDWDAVDSPPLTDAMLRNMRPAPERMPPRLLEKLAERRKVREQAGAREEVTLSLDRDVVEHFKAEGEDWRGRMSAALRQAVRTKRERAPGDAQP